MGTRIERVHSYKILGKILSHDLTWNAHVEITFSKRANKRLYTIRTLKKACVPKGDIVKVYISLIPSILEYAVPAWENIPLYLQDAIESIQKRALAVIFPGVPYDEALQTAGVTTLTARSDNICKSALFGTLKPPDSFLIYYQLQQKSPTDTQSVQDS